MKKQISTQIEINATPDKVWNILMNFEAYAEWNPFIKSISGEAIVGKHIKASIQPPDAMVMAVKPMVLANNKNTEFRWLGKLLFKGLFDGEHIFQLIDNNDGSTTFIQSEKFEGILVSLFSKMLDVNTVNGFNMMNRALKQKAELT